MEGCSGENALDTFMPQIPERMNTSQIGHGPDYSIIPGTDRETGHRSR